MKLQRKFIAIVLFMSCFNGFSQIDVTTNFNIVTNLAIDTRINVVDITARDNINILYRYQGMLVYVQSNQTNYQLIGGLTNAFWQTLNLTGAVYTAGTGLTLSGNAFSLTPHTGDVTGTTNLTIMAIQGRTLATTTPTSGDVLTWNGSAWAPVSSATQYASGTGLTLTGNTFSADNTLPIWNADQLNGSSISTIAPAVSQLLKWNSVTSEWTPADETAYATGIGLTLSGNTFSADNTAAIWNANLLNGSSISTTGPAANQLLKWNSVTSAWTPADETAYTTGTGLTLTGNTFSADNTAAIWNANLLNGTAISTTDPASNQLLKWNSVTSEWTPADETAYDAGTGIFIFANTITADNNAPLWNARMIWGNDISSTTPTGNQLLRWDGTVWAPADETAYDAGIGLTLTGNTFSADNTAAIWNANLLNGTAISTTGPASNQLLKWNSVTSEWTPADETSYYAGTGLTITGSTFLALNTTAIWNANQIMGSALSTTTPSTNGQILKWNSATSEWEPGSETVYSAGTGLILTGTTFSISVPIPVNLGGTGQTSFTSGKLLIGNSSGGLTQNDLTPGTGMSITNGDGSITITNADPNQTHSGDAIGASAITVVGLQGRTIATTVPTDGNVLSWNSSSSSWIPAASNSYDGNRAIKRATWPNNINIGTTTNITDFLNAVFFPFLSATISINANALYEIGTSNSVTISGSTTVRDETVFSDGRIDQTYPSTTTIYSFGASTTYSTSFNFIPDQSIPSTLELRFVAYQGVANNGTPITINSSTKYVQSCYPFLHGVSSDNLVAGGTFTYATLSGKLVEVKSDKTVSFTGTGYIYFCFPASYGTLTSIFDQNGYAMFSSFALVTASVTSTGLTNNWTESYNIYRSSSQTTPTGWIYQFKF